MPKHSERDEKEPERHERKQQAIDAAEAHANDLRARFRLEAHSTIERPADSEAESDERELDPSRRRRHLRRYRSEIERSEHWKIALQLTGLQEFAAGRRAIASIDDVRIPSKARSLSNAVNSMRSGSPRNGSKSRATLGIPSR